VVERAPNAEIKYPLYLFNVGIQIDRTDILRHFPKASECVVDVDQGRATLYFLSGSVTIFDWIVICLTLSLGHSGGRIDTKDIHRSV
jgi:hypothetical protein